MEKSTNKVSKCKADKVKDKKCLKSGQKEWVKGGMKFEGIKKKKAKLNERKNQ